MAPACLDLFAINVTSCPARLAYRKPTPALRTLLTGRSARACLGFYSSSGKRSFRCRCHSLLPSHPRACSLSLDIALRKIRKKKNDFVASRWKINRKKGKGKSVIQVELLTARLTNLTHIPFAQLLFVFCIILVL